MEHFQKGDQKVARYRRRVILATKTQKIGQSHYISNTNSGQDCLTKWYAVMHKHEILVFLGLIFQVLLLLYYQHSGTT